MKRHKFIRIRIRQEAVIRKRRRAKSIVRYRNIQKGKCKKSIKQKKRQLFASIPYIADAPADFSLSNIEGIVSFIHRIEVKCCRGTRVNFLRINMDSVRKIDSIAISLLLSLLNKLSCLNIRYMGTYPDDDSSKQFIINSGFLDIVKTNINKPSNNRIGNQIFMVGKDSVDSHLIGQAVRESMINVTGVREPYSPAYDNLLEISANSVEHANQIRVDKNWLISMSLEDDKVHYVVTDTGAGILATLRKKATEQLRDTFMKGDAQVLHDVFKKLYQSVTGESNRHKGLPVILESFTDGFISDLMVITNKVKYDFSSNSYTILRKGFNGVLYSWTVSKVNYDNWINTL